MPEQRSHEEVKAVLRREMRRRRRDYVDGLREPERRDLFGALAEIVENHISLPADVASYWAIGTEIDPARIDERVRASGGRLGLPRIVKADMPLAFHETEGKDASLRPGAHDIPEPDAAAPALTPDIVLVPLLAADMHGNRLGQGKGYYDRTLQRLRAKGTVTAIGLAYDMQIVAHLPADPHDAQLDFIATPERWIVCHAGAPGQ